MPRKVLVCDNEAALRVLVRATLGDAHTVVEARDGGEAVELINGSSRTSCSST
jgi:CheY-like chemotaxis protein